jgi:hypothetical protein
LRLLIPPYFGRDLLEKIREEGKAKLGVRYHFNGEALPIGRA